MNFTQHTRGVQLLFTMGIRLSGGRGVGKSSGSTDGVLIVRMLMRTVVAMMMIMMTMTVQVSGTQDQNVETTGPQDQPEIELNSVASARGVFKVAQASHKGQVEELNEKAASIDHLLEEATLPNHLSWEDGEEAGCTPGTVLSELDVCLTPAQLTHFLPVSLPHNAISSKSRAAGSPRSNNNKQQRQKRQIHPLIFSLWAGAVVPYIFNATFPHRDRMLVLSAMAEWERVTCIRFRPATPDDRDLVVFQDGKRCSTNIGRVGGQQLLTLAQPCRRKRILIHELGHVLGLIHEHQRQDRDNYVTVMLHNVRNSSQERYQFSKLAPSPLTDGQVQYSYTSIMHYGKNYFARSPELTTLLTADPKYQDIIGRAVVPADSDAEAVNLMYGCPAPTQNRLPDATCELFKRTGECEGLNKATVRPLCPRSCRLPQQGYRSHVGGGYPPTRTTSQLSSAHRKTHTPVWGQSSNVIGLGTRIADTLMSSTIHPAPNTAIRGGLEPSRKRTSVFGNIPSRGSSRPFTLRGQQPQQQPRHQPSVPLSKWFPSLFKTRRRPSSGAFQVTTADQLPAWFRTRQLPARSSQQPKTIQPRRNKSPPPAVERQMGVGAGVGADVSMAAHNMKALSPEALPETPGRTPPTRDANLGGGEVHQAQHTRYSYNRPQHLSLLQGMLSHGSLPTETPQQGRHVTRPLHRHVSASYSSRTPVQGTRSSVQGTRSSAHGPSHSAHGPEQSSSFASSPSSHHSPSTPITEAPPLLGLLGSGPRDSWSQPSPSSSSSSYSASSFHSGGWTSRRSSAFAASPHHNGPSAEGWYLGSVPSQGGGGAHTGLVGGFESFRSSNRNGQHSGSALHSLASAGPDSISFYAQ